MRTIGEIKTEILVRAGANTSAGFYSDTILDNWIDDAHKWVAGRKKWPATEGRSSTTFASLSTNKDSYLQGQYPEGWKPDSIRRLSIDGKKVEKKDFYKFAEYLEDNSSAQDRIFTDRFRYYYVNPNIDVSGSVVVWGQYTPATLDATDTDATTVFSDGLEDLNEAIVEKSLSYASKREKDKNGSQLHEQNALAIIKEAWDDITNEQFQYQEIGGDGMFERFDVVEGGFRDDIIKRDRF